MNKRTSCGRNRIQFLSISIPLFGDFAQATIVLQCLTNSKLSLPHAETQFLVVLFVHPSASHQAKKDPFFALQIGLAVQHLTGVGGAFKPLRNLISLKQDCESFTGACITGSFRNIMLVNASRVGSVYFWFCCFCKTRGGIVGFRWFFNVVFFLHQQFFEKFAAIFTPNWW